MQLLAAPLSKLCPDEQAACGQSIAASRLLAQAEVIPLTLQELALLQIAEANELHAATGLLVSEPHADRSRENDAATTRLRIGDPLGKRCGASLSPSEMPASDPPPRGIFHRGESRLDDARVVESRPRGNSMSWKLIFALSLFGLAMGAR
jgi:hypothetical protein